MKRILGGRLHRTRAWSFYRGSGGMRLVLGNRLSGQKDRLIFPLSLGSNWRTLDLTTFAVLMFPFPDGIFRSGWRVWAFAHAFVALFTVLEASASAATPAAPTPLTRTFAVL